MSGTRDFHGESGGRERDGGAETAESARSWRDGPPMQSGGDSASLHPTVAAMTRAVLDDDPVHGEGGHGFGGGRGMASHRPFVPGAPAFDGFPRMGAVPGGVHPSMGYPPHGYPMPPAMGWGGSGGGAPGGGHPGVPSGAAIGARVAPPVGLPSQYRTMPGTSWGAKDSSGTGWSGQHPDVSGVWSPMVSAPTETASSAHASSQSSGSRSMPPMESFGSDEGFLATGMEGTHTSVAAATSTKTTTSTVAAPMTSSSSGPPTTTTHHTSTSSTTKATTDDKDGEGEKVVMTSSTTTTTSSSSTSSSSAIRDALASLSRTGGSGSGSGVAEPGDAGRMSALAGDGDGFRQARGRGGSSGGRSMTRGGGSSGGRTNAFGYSRHFGDDDGGGRRGGRGGGGGGGGRRFGSGFGSRDSGGSRDFGRDRDALGRRGVRATSKAGLSHVHGRHPGAPIPPGHSISSRSRGGGGGGGGRGRGGRGGFRGGRDDFLDDDDSPESPSSAPTSFPPGLQLSVSEAVRMQSGRVVLTDILARAVKDGGEELKKIRRELLEELMPTMREVARGQASNFFFQELYKVCTLRQRIDILRKLFVIPAPPVDGPRAVIFRGFPQGTVRGNGDDSMDEEADDAAAGESSGGGGSGEDGEGEVVGLDLDYVSALSTDRHGTRAMQQMVTAAESINERNILLSCVLPLVKTLGQSRGGCHVLMGFLLEKDTVWPDEQRSLIAFEIARFAEHISQDRYGSRVVQHLLEGSAGTLPEIEMVAKYVADQAPGWIRHESANFLVSTLFWNASRFREQAERAAAESVCGDVFNLVCHRCGSHVVQAALGSELLPSTRLSIVEELCHPDRAGAVCSNRFGNYVCQAAIRAAVGNQEASHMVATLYVAACLSPPTAGPGPRCVRDLFQKSFPEMARTLAPTGVPGPGGLPGSGGGVSGGGSIRP